MMYCLYLLLYGKRVSQCYVTVPENQILLSTDSTRFENVSRISSLFSLINVVETHIRCNESS